jgi:hypothetical protein
MYSAVMVHREIIYHLELYRMPELHVELLYYIILYHADKEKIS